MAGMRGIPAERRDTTTKNKDRKQQIRDRMQVDQVPYTEAARRVDAEKPDPYERERKIRTRMHASRFPMAYAAAEILVDREARGLPAAPEDWRSVWPHMASSDRPRNRPTAAPARPAAAPPRSTATRTGLSACCRR
jgi:hypothetical protein